MKSRLGIILFGALVSLGAHAQNVLLDFSNGNQIFGSYLTVYDDGVLLHKERSCCPPHTDAIQEVRFSRAQLSHLQGLIRAASSSNVRIRDGNLTTDGSQSGELIAFYNNAKLVIYKVERSSIGTPDKVTYNTSPAAAEIQKIVYVYVKWPLQ